MIDSRGRLKRCRAVAILTNIGGLHVSGALAGRSKAIMAANAITHDPEVVKNGRQPRRCIMAIVALIVGRYMARSFTRGLHAIVAVRTIAGDRCVIHEGDD